MKYSKSLTGLALLAAATGCSEKKQAQPNIVFFLVDDMGWVDSEVAYGTEVYPNNQRFNTPNMRRLAEQGMVMGNAYACAVSTPTRTSMMTGMNAAHTRITNWTSIVRDTPSDATGGALSMEINRSGAETPSGELLRPDWNINGISPVEGVPYTQVCTPMAQLLKDAGYYTIHAGKAHFASAGTPAANVYNLGFCVNVGGTMAGQPRSYQGRDNYGNTPELWNHCAVQNMTEYYGTETHLTEALTREALKTLDYPVSHGQPFYLYLAHYATHTPIQPDERFVQKYRDAGMDEGQARYASMVEGVDKSLGDVLDYLDAHGLSENTVIIFMTDNGGNAENKQKGGIPHTHNKPLREGKGSCYEGGIRVPLMFCWPGKVAAGSRCEVPVICEDLFPTILSMAGVRNYETVQDVDGEDLVPLITKGEGVSAERELVFHYPHKWKPYDLVDIDYLSAMVKGDWKIVYRMLTDEVELYNLREDIGEEVNVAAQYPEKAAEMARGLSDKLRGWDAVMPVVAATGEPVQMPDHLFEK